jgi:prevent-host-death family protein
MTDLRDLKHLKQLSATDAARRFSEVLDRIEQRGESVTIVRHGRAVATIGPAGAGTGKALKEALRAHPPDPDWADELRELREFIGPVQDRWPD